VQGVFGVSVRLVVGALALVAGLWLFHPGFAPACNLHTPGLCGQSVWDKPANESERAAAKPDRSDDVAGLIAAARTKRLAADFSGAMAALDRAGQVALRRYEAEEIKTTNRKVRYGFVDLDLEARRLAVAAEAGGAKAVSVAAGKLADVFASLASVEGIELVLRRANLRAPKDLTGALQSDTLKAAIAEFWQDLAPTQVYFATNRAQYPEEMGYFGDTIGPLNAVTFGEASVAVPVYSSAASAARDAKEIDDAPEQGLRQTVSVRTVKHLDQAQTDARLRETLKAARTAEALIYVHGADVSFEHALVRAAELKRALRIDGPVLALSWGADRDATVDCAGASTAKLVLMAWKGMAAATGGSARLTVIAHGQGVCAINAPYDHSGGASDAETPADHLVMMAPDYGHKDIEGPFHRAPTSAAQVMFYFDQAARTRDNADEACPWDANPDKRKALSSASGPAEVQRVEIGASPAMANRLLGADYVLDSVLLDLRGYLWSAAGPAARCGMCRLTKDRPEIWRHYAERCGADKSLALDLRREYGAAAEANLDRTLAGLSQAERDMVRDSLKALPAAP
jgi:hypothetical protein